MKQIVCRIYDRLNPTTLLGTLTTDSDRNWRHQRSEVGSGSLVIHADDPDVAILLYRNIVRMRLNGTDRFAWVIEKRSRRSIVRGGQRERLLVVSGRGVLALFEKAVLDPELGVQRLSPDTRTFNFASVDYDASAWVVAEEIKQQSDTGTFPGQWEDADGNPAPESWPDPDAFWIWGQAQGVGSPPQPVGDCFFRKSFNLASEKTVAIFVSADDGFELYLDDEVVAAETRAFMWGETKRHNTFLEAGDHLIAIKATNILRANAATNVAGVICSIIETDEGGQSLGSVIERTDSTWDALAYPSDPPIMSVGAVLRVVIDEAQARGDLPGVSLGFTDALDSDGNAWGTTPAEVYRVGTNLLAMIRQMCEVAIDVELTPTLVLNAYNKGDLGSDLTGSISLLEDVHLSGLEHDGEGPLTNDALVKYPVGERNRWLRRQRASSVSAHGPLESYLELGTAASEAQVLITADAILEEHGEPTIVATFECQDITGERPYVDWSVGDTILVPGDDDTPTETVVESITVGETLDEGGAGIATFKVEGTQAGTSGSGS
jgi:hypothetical protein